MNTAVAESRTAEAAAYGGFFDAIGGIATAVLAIIALSGFNPMVLSAVATIVFGAALLIEAGTLLSEYAQIIFPTGTAARSTEAVGGENDGGLAAMFLVGAAGIVLGILSLLGIASAALTAVAVIAFGAALILSSGSVRHLYVLQTSARRMDASQTGSEVLAGEMSSGSSGLQLLIGLAAVVLGILATAGIRTPLLTLVGLLILGVTVILTGSTLSGLILSFMRPTDSTTSTS